MKPNFSKIMTNALAAGFNMLNQTQRLFDEFDSEALTKAVTDRKNDLLIRGNEWLNQMNDFFKEVKDTVTAFTVTVPFEQGKDTINYGVKNGILTIVTEFQTKSSSRKSTNTVTVPDDCDTTRMKHTINKDKGTVTIIIPKKASEKGVDGKLQKEIENARNKAKETVKLIRKTFNDAVEEGKKVVEEAKKTAEVKATAPKAKKVTAPKATVKKPAPKATVKKTAPKAKKAVAPKATVKK